MKWSYPRAYRLTDTARALAGWLHHDQTDLQGQPYFMHLRRVAECVARHGGTPEQVAAAWLHDSIEDGHIGMGVIRAIFPSAVADMVVDLSRFKQEESYEEYIHRLTTDPRAKPALLVKLADLLDNMDRSRGPAPERLTKRYEAALPKIRAAMEEAREEVSA